MTPRGATTPASVFVWLDVIALDQNPVLNHQADTGIVKSLVKSCSEGKRDSYQEWPCKPG